jgi:transposase
MATKKTKKTAAKRITAAKTKAIKGAKARAAKTAKAKADKPANGAPKAGTKLAMLTEMLSAKDGATTAELCKKLGWLPHTLRAAISRLPNKPTHSRVDGVTSYRIEA